MWLLGHFHFGNQVAGGGVPADKFDRCLLPNATATAVAPDEILSTERPPVRKGDVDPAVVLGKVRHFAAAIARHAKVYHPVRQDTLDPMLQDGEPVGVASRKVADGEGTRANDAVCILCPSERKRSTMPL